MIHKVYRDSQRGVNLAYGERLATTQEVLRKKVSTEKWYNVTLGDKLKCKDGLLDVDVDEFDEYLIFS